MNNPLTTASDAIRALVQYTERLEGDFIKTGKEIERLEAIDLVGLRSFLKEPWCILPKSREEWWVVVPKWAGVQAGWLERTTDTYNVFLVNRYSIWIGGVPEELRDTLNIPEPFKANVEGGVLRTDHETADRFRRHLRGGDEKNGFRVTRGHEFDLIAEIIEAGSLPFRPRPVDPKDLRPAHEQGPPATLRGYQKEGWEKFLQYGAVSICWPWGMGKTVFGVHAISSIKGEKLIVVPTRTLIEQWRERLTTWGPPAWGREVEILTYNSWERVKDREYALVIFDESHRLPANTFSRLSTIRAKYRIGLSATPYREDGRTHYIFALTGIPIGIDWTKYIREGLITPPKVRVEVVGGWREKVNRTAAEIASSKGRTIVFCDSIDKGRELANRLNCPHVFAETKDRIGVIKNAIASVVSRVGDEGLSIPDLRKVIEVDFHGGSRRQEGQRVGRLLHADGKGEHVVLITQEEFDSFERRFLALQEKGIHVSVTGER